MKFRRFSVVLASGLLAALLSPAVSANEQPHPFAGQRVARVMTRNMYFGADLTPVITAPTPQAFVAAATVGYLQAQATNFPERIAAMADEIAENQPMLVGLQEVTTWRTGPAFDPNPATTVTADFLAMLLTDLEARGASYAALAVVPGFDAEVPTGLGIDVRLSVADVLLARTDLKTADFKFENVQTGTYAAALTFPTVVGPIAFPRQWASVDVKIRGKQFRFITTHLEAFSQYHRVAQAAELLAGPTVTDLPTVMVGDFNAEPDTAGDAAALLIGAGFADTWAVAMPGVAGFTCCQAADVANPTPTLSERIDLVFARDGEFQVLGADLVGEAAGDRTASGLWPSDHAGVVVTLQIPD